MSFIGFLILTLVNNKSYKGFNQEFTFSMMSIPFGVGFFMKFWSLMILFDFNNNFILFLMFLIFFEWSFFEWYDNFL